MISTNTIIVHAPISASCNVSGGCNEIEKLTVTEGSPHPSGVA